MQGVTPPSSAGYLASLTSLDNHSATLYSIRLKTGEEPMIIKPCGSVYQVKATFDGSLLEEMQWICPKAECSNTKKYPAVEEL